MGCAGHSTRPNPQIEYRYLADLPDANLVAPCDTRDAAVRDNGDLAQELPRVRRQRNDCAAQVDGLRRWRGEAAQRAEKANNPD